LRLNALCNLAQALIARQMAIAVVELFEIIDIDLHHAQALAADCVPGEIPATAHQNSAGWQCRSGHH
jgi:hypothetical protein